MHLSGAALRTLGRAPASAPPPVGVEEVRRAVEAVVHAVDRKHAAVRSTLRAAVAVALRPDGARAPAGAAAAAATVAAASELLRTRSVDAIIPACGGTPSPLACRRLCRARSVGPHGPASDGDGEAADGDSDDGPAEWFLLPGGPGREQRPRGRSVQSGSGDGSGRRRSPQLPQGVNNRAAGRRGRAGRPNSPSPVGQGCC
jgi:hypothetical protein